MADKEQKTIAYDQITLEIRNAIHRGKYRPGERMPTLVELASQYNVSNSTIRLVFKQLATEGLLIVYQGRGTFVAPPKQRFCPVESCREQFERRGKTVQTKIIETCWVEPHRDAQAILQIPQDTKVWSVFVVYYIDGVAAMAEVFDIPLEIANKLVGDTRKVQSLVKILREELGYKTLAIDVIGVDILNERFYHVLLNTQTGVYEIRRVFSCNRKPLMLSYIGLRCDQFSLDFRSTIEDISLPQDELDEIHIPSHRRVVRERLLENNLTML